MDVVQFDDNGTADHNWRFIPDGTVKLQVVHTGKVLAIQDMSRENGAQLTQWPPTGTPDHLWRFVDAGAGHFRIVSDLLVARHSGKVLEISGRDTADGAPVTQWQDLRLDNQRWRIVQG